MVFAAENAAVHGGIEVEKFVSLHCNLGHSFYSCFQCRNHANRPITEQMLCLLHVLFSRIKHQKRKLMPTATPTNKFFRRLVQYVCTQRSRKISQPKSGSGSRKNIHFVIKICSDVDCITSKKVHAFNLTCLMNI